MVLNSKSLTYGCLICPCLGASKIKLAPNLVSNICKELTCVSTVYFSNSLFLFGTSADILVYFYSYILFNSMRSVDFRV